MKKNVTTRVVLVVVMALSFAAILCGCASIEKRQEKADEFNELGDEYFEDEKYDLAIAEYSKAINLYKDWSYYSNRAAAYNELGDKVHALLDYTMAIGVAPNEKSPYIDRGIFHFNNGNYNEAKADFQKALSIKMPADPMLAARAGFDNTRANNYLRKISEMGL